MKESSQPIPAGVYLPTRAWRTTRTEIVLLAEANGRSFTYAFTPEDLMNHPEAGDNRVRAKGVTNSVHCFWPPDQLELFLKLMKQTGCTELAAQDFRISSDGRAAQAIGKARHAL